MLALLLLLLSAPAAPHLTTVQTTTGTDAVLAWDPPAPNTAAPTGYLVLHGTTCDALVDQVDTKTPALTFTWTGLSGATGHCFAVKAYNEGGTSPASATATIAPLPPPPPPPPPPPANPCVQANGAKTLAVSLLAIQSTVARSEAGYVVFRVYEYPSAAGQPPNLASVDVWLETGERVLHTTGTENPVNVRVTAGVWFRPVTPGRTKAYVRITNAYGCAAESAHQSVTVK